MVVLRPIEIAPAKVIVRVDIRGGIGAAYGAAFARIFCFGPGPVIGGDILSTCYDNYHYK